MTNYNTIAAPLGHDTDAEDAAAREVEVQYFIDALMKMGAPKLLQDLHEQGVWEVRAAFRDVTPFGCPDARILKRARAADLYTECFAEHYLDDWIQHRAEVVADELAGRME